MTFKDRDAKAAGDRSSGSADRKNPTPSNGNVVTSPAAAKPGPPSEAMAALKALQEVLGTHAPSFDYQEEPKRWKRLADAIRALDARAKEQVEHIKGLAESLVTETARAEKAEAEAANLLELVKEHAEPDDDAEGTCPRCYEAVRRAALRVKP